MLTTTLQRLLLNRERVKKSVQQTYLVKLIDANDSSIGEHHGSGFQTSFAALLVRRDRGGQTDT